MINGMASWALPFFSEITLSLLSLIGLGAVAFKRSLNFKLVLGAVCVSYLGLFLFDENLLSYEMPLGLLKKDLLSLIFGGLVLFTGFLSLGFSKEEKNPETYILLFLSLVGLMFLVSANHMITLYLGVELATFPLYAWIALRRDQAHALESAMKYFVLGGLASGFLLLGCSLMYSASGALSFEVLQQVLSASSFEQSPVFVLGICFAFSALFFKLGLAPFHVWLPDVYQGATWRQVAYLGLPAKIAMVGLVIKLLFFSFFTQASAPVTQKLLMLVVYVSLIIGPLGALLQTSVKRLIAFSGITHMGYMGLGFLSGLTPGAYGDGIPSVIAYVVAYALTTSLLFLVFFSFKHKTTHKELESLEDLKGFSKSYPFQAAMIALCLVSLMGIPPLPVFWGKISILLNAVEKGFLTLAFLAVLSTVVSAFYYLKVIRTLYFSEEQESALACDGTGKIWTRVLFVLMISYAYYQTFFQIY